MLYFEHLQSGRVIRSDERLTFEMSVSKLFTVVNLRYELK